MADRLQQTMDAIEEHKHDTPEEKDALWGRIIPTASPWNNADLQKAAEFVLNNKIIPRLVPSEEALQGPAVFERKGAASDGLQQYGQRLNAALAPAPLTGR